jgi:hypothetical protein
MRKLIAGLVLAWWVMVRMVPYLGPFDQPGPCNNAAADVAANLHVPAVCLFRSY